MYTVRVDANFSANRCCGTKGQSNVLAPYEHNFGQRQTSKPNKPAEQQRSPPLPGERSTRHRQHPTSNPNLLLLPNARATTKNTRKKHKNLCMYPEFHSLLLEVGQLLRAAGHPALLQDLQHRRTERAEGGVDGEPHLEVLPQFVLALP